MEKSTNKSRVDQAEVTAANIANSVVFESTPAKLPTRAGGKVTGAPDPATSLSVAETAELKIQAGDISIVAIDRLRANPRNARRHRPEQIARLAASIERFGFLGAIVVDGDGMILAGHGRWQAAMTLGMKQIPCQVVDHLDKSTKRAFALADNRIAELSEWDDERLKVELGELESTELDFEIELTGFDTVDLDRILGPEPDPRGKRGSAEGYSTDPDDHIGDLLRDRPAITAHGDLWILGPDRLLCGDALDPASYVRLLEGDRAAQVVTDPPYNVPVARHVTGAAGFAEFVQASGEMSPADFTAFLTQALRLSAANARDGAILHIFMDWRHQPELLTAANAAGLSWRNLCVWGKPSAGMGSFYRSQHELVLVFKAGTGPHINNFELGQFGRSRSNLWCYPAVRGQRRGVNAADGGHPTVKPAAMIIDAIKDCSRRGDIILDPFGGSGTTIIAAERCHRRGYVIELDPYYVDLAIRRYQVVTGNVARYVDGRSFDEIMTERCNTAPGASASEARK